MSATIAILAGLMAAAAASAPPETVETVTYEVKPGDTLIDLQRKYLLPGKDWPMLQRITKVRVPRYLPIGMKIEIPRDWLRYDVQPAQLVSFRGTVGLSARGRALTPAAGLSVGEGVEIVTGANSFATLILANRSKVTIPSQSRVTVRELRRIILTGSLDYRIEVQAGKLETKVTPLGDPTGRYRIGTPISMTAVRGTEFRVGFDDKATNAAAEVLEGNVAVAPPGATTEVVLPRGEGATTDSSGATKTEPLLPAPDLIEPGRVQTKDQVEFALKPVFGAVRYHVTLATDAGFVENFAEQIAATPSFALPDVPNGNQFVRVSAIAASGLEGMAQSYSFKRHLASIRAEASQTEDGYRFRWFGEGEGIRRYRFQLMRDKPESQPVVDEVGLERDQLTLRNLRAGTYFWRVAVLQTDASGQVETWTDPEKITISNPGG